MLLKKPRNHGDKEEGYGGFSHYCVSPPIPSLITRRGTEQIISQVMDYSSIASWFGNGGREGEEKHVKDHKNVGDKRLGLESRGWSPLLCFLHAVFWGEDREPGCYESIRDLLLLMDDQPVVNA